MTESKSLKDRGWWWPSVADKEGAKKTAQQGAGAAVLVSAVTTLFTVLALFGIHILPGLSALSLVDAGVFAIVAWRIYRMSRAWAVVGLVLFVYERVYAFSVRVSMATPGIIVEIILVLAFINSVRGTFAYHNLEKKTHEKVEASK